MTGSESRSGARAAATPRTRSRSARRQQAVRFHATMPRFISEYGVRIGGMAGGRGQLRARKVRSIVAREGARFALTVVIFEKNAWFRSGGATLSVAIWLAACHGPASRRSEAKPGASSAPLAELPVGSARPPAAPVTSSASRPTAPLAPLEITNGVAGQFQVRANVPLELSTQANIEVQTPTGKWKAYADLDGGKGYHLRESCSPELPACRTLAAGERLDLAAWSGSSCSAQCEPECQFIDRFHSGVHRLVLHACGNSGARYDGPPFAMAASARELWRWRAAAGIQGGQVFRLDPHGLDEKKAGPPEYIAGFHVVKASGRPVAPELLVDLAAWLRDRDGFVQYDVSKRCMQGHVVGFLLHVTAARLEEQTVEVALNLACNVSYVTTRDGRGRTNQSSHFDPSWARILSIVRRALPDDSELAALLESPTNFPANFDHQPN